MWLNEFYLIIKFLLIDGSQLYNLKSFLINMRNCEMVRFRVMFVYKYVKLYNIYVYCCDVLYKISIMIFSFVYLIFLKD